MEDIIEVETWKDIAEYEGLYKVSNMGRIKSLNRIVYGRDNRSQKLKGKILILSIAGNGYLTVVLYKNGKGKTFCIHKLVYEMFKGKVPKGHTIDHITEDNKLNNRLSNLQILTNRENVGKSKKHKGATSQYIGVSWHTKSEKWRAAISINRRIENLGYFNNEIDAANAYKNAKESI